MSLIICPECGHENQEDARYCDMCGIELPFSAPAETYSQEEEFAPNISEDNSYEEEVAQVPSIQAEESFEEEIYEAPLAESEEVFQQEIYQTPIAEPEEIMLPNEPGESFEEETYQTPMAEAEESLEPTPSVAPISSATVLDWEEPPLSSQPSTALEVTQGILIHSETETRFELPTNETMVYLGKINEEMPVQIDLSSLPDADIISRVHAVIHVEEKNFYLEDAGSLNGTALNGEPLKPGARFRKQLNSGDTITLGRNKKVNLTFEIQE